MERKVMTVSLIYEHSRILLAMKKRGFGEGRWNGYGGKPEEGETIEETAIREMREESGIKISKLEKIGIMSCHFEDNPGRVFEVHYFRVLEYSGEAEETEEMRPKWFDVVEIPYDQMWPGDKFWMHEFLGGNKFRGDTYFKDKDTLIRSDVQVVDAL